MEQGSGPSQSVAGGRPKTSAAKKDGHYVLLDGARGYAALAVVVYHVMATFNVHGIIPGSFLAVDLFFLMSGFVIAYSYEKRLQEGTMSFWRFFEIRTIRLYPLYAVSIALGALFFCTKIIMGEPDAPPVKDMLLAVPGSVLMLPVFPIGDTTLINYPFSPSAWSLVLEFWFNLVFALVAIRWGVKALAVLAAVSFAVLVQQSMAAGTTDLGWGISSLLGGSARFWFSFTVGVILFRLKKPGVALSPVWLLLAAPVLLFILLPHDAVPLQLVWIAVAFPMFVYICSRISVGGIAAVISDHLGRLSYAIYIIHTPTILLAFGVLTVLVGPVWRDYPLESGIYALTGVLIASALSTYLFDEPFRRWLRTKTAPRKPAPPKMAAAQP